MQEKARNPARVRPVTSVSTPGRNKSKSTEHIWPRRVGCPSMMCRPTFVRIREDWNDAGGRVSLSRTASDTDVLVPLGVASVDQCAVDLCPHAGPCGLVPNGDGSGEPCEAASHPDHEVTYGEVDLGVNEADLPHAGELIKVDGGGQHDDLHRYVGRGAVQQSPLCTSLMTANVQISARHLCGSEVGARR